MTTELISATAGSSPCAGEPLAPPRTGLTPVLVPPATKPVTSVVRLAEHWYVACRSEDLKPGKLRPSTLLGMPIVLFRDGAGAAGALLDRCPHRNVPLSLGRVVEGRLQCGYHGWEFEADGACAKVPGLCGDPTAKGARGRRAQALATREQQGLVWVFATPGVEPDVEPFRLPDLEAGYTEVRQEVTAEATLHATIENALDVPHTAFLHAGLFRGTGKTNRIEAIVRRWDGTVECEYVGEPRPEGVVGRMLSPSGGLVVHHDRFVLPSIAQVEYRIGTENHILVTSFATPEEDFRTRMTAVVRLKLRIPAWLVRPFLQPIAMRIFKQDARVLEAQTVTVRRFGGEQFVSTELDLLGGPILRLMKDAADGPVPSGEPPRELRRVWMEV